MPLSLDRRRAGDVTIVACSGRIVLGDETDALQRLLDELTAVESDLILDLGAIDFVDSSGLGLLARYAARARHAGGRLRLCAVSPKVAHVLRVTKLDAVFDTYPSEAHAVDAALERRNGPTRHAHLRAEILCVDASPDVQAYVREILGVAGYAVMSAGNLADGVTLLQGLQPKLVIVSAELRQARDTQSASKFNGLADALTVIELVPNFAKRDAGYAGHVLVQQVRSALPLAGHASGVYA